MNEPAPEYDPAAPNLEHYDHCPKCKVGVMVEVKPIYENGTQISAYYECQLCNYYAEL